MARLTLVQKRGKFSINIPHKILIDGHLLGIMKDKQVSIEMPAGSYDITIQSLVPLISATQHIELPPLRESTLSFSDREQYWDALVLLDIVLWSIKSLLRLTSPWTWIYEIFTNGTFILWLIYEWCIRNKYFKFTIN